jgi:transposase
MVERKDVGKGMHRTNSEKIEPEAQERRRGRPRKLDLAELAAIVERFRDPITNRATASDGAIADAVEAQTGVKVSADTVRLLRAELGIAPVRRGGSRPGARTKSAAVKKTPRRLVISKEALIRMAAAQWYRWDPEKRKYYFRGPGARAMDIPTRLPPWGATGGLAGGGSGKEGGHDAAGRK